MVGVSAALHLAAMENVSLEMIWKRLDVIRADILDVRNELGVKPQ